MASSHGERRHRDRDESSDSGRDRKRKRDKTDKKEKKEKDRADRRGDDRKNRKRDLDDRDDDRGHGYGYGGIRDETDRRTSRRPEGDYRGDRDGRGDRGDRGDRDRRGDRRDRERIDDDVPRQSRRSPPPDSPQLKQAQNWREEVDEEGEDLRDVSDDEDAAAKKLEESRKRRAAMMAQAKPTSKADGNEENDARTPDPAQNGGHGPANSDKDASKGEQTNPKKVKDDDDVEGAGDMFDISESASQMLKSSKQQAKHIGLTGASTDDWDDGDGYYLAQVGELLEDRFVVQDTVSGRGVFSNVVKAKDTKTEGQPMVALKIIRSNDMMKKAAEKEVEILQTLNNADKGNKKHIIRLIETFYYRKHIFLVFECMAEDLRGALKKYTKNKGMSLPAVRAYTKQLLTGVRHMHKFNIIHADLKPDNILISADNNTVKLCDFGTAVESKDVGVSPYLMSRFYRPAEVILGCEYSLPVDIWALSCTLFEIFTGKTLLQGKTNNDMLKKIMDLKGKLPRNVIKKGAVWKQHFDDNLDFKYIDKDSMTGEEITRVITDNSAKKELKDYIMDRVGTEKRLSQDREDQQYVKKSLHFSDLLDKMLALDPDKRLTAEDALKHHFLEDPKSKKEGGNAASAGQVTQGRR